MTGSRFRRATGLYLVLFFLAVAAAPHHHINDLEDLLLDQRSDSGLVTLVCAEAQNSDEQAFHPYRIARDVSCLACFTGDFVSVATSAFSFVSVFTRLPLRPVPPIAAMPELLSADTPSRAPPRDC